MDFDTTIRQAWADHANAPRDVAARWPDLRALVTGEPQLERLIALTLHVHGPHLGDWAGGAAALESLRSLAAYRDDGNSGAAMRRCMASLALCAGTQARGTIPLSASDDIRVHAMAAESLIDFDTPRATRLLKQAVDLADRSGLPASDATHRSLAVAANNLTCTLEEKKPRSDDERTLMIYAAQTARHHWALAGTWLEIERAEYRLAMTWLQAGDVVKARQHAQSCLEIIDSNQGAALERLFGWEALGLVERAAGNATGHARALEMARAALAELSEEDRGWCQESVDKLAA